ncbi:AraC family transcriptional regulator [Marinobacter qingdaonensis]|uniref:AraC family transcriptional regulator ligand-binding domain-containing protein n=1 Tax=Marinobacter qingdaonensis TaxID=3108486 RepID=A0ABU5NYF0_9GAMM|nr:AraC family transcriptional regulator ligand-binding domain-containing protein [Marinobacter sp. ASW11-75]MEA1080818.1 AraC family transcriptional regulator ligand-binding domain-containing protein [Marinobacter sp. ASW11-75]
MTKNDHLTTTNQVAVSIVSSQPTVPGTYVLLLLDVTERWNVPMAELLGHEGLVLEDLLRSGFRLPRDCFARLIEQAISLTGEPGIGFLMGLQMKVSCHGVIGQAAMVARTLGEALDIAIAYFKMPSSDLELCLDSQGDEVRLALVERDGRYQLGEVGAMFLLTGFAAMAEALTGSKLRGRGVVRFAKPSYMSRFDHLMAGPLTFNGGFNGFIFDRSILDSRLVMSDPVAARVAREQCKEELGRLGGGRSLAQQVRDLVFDEEMGFASIEEVAAKLHVTPRTLQRRLRAEGAVFRELVESIRQQHARRLLALGQKSIGQVSDLLGYSDVTNFSRAFRRWTGRSPREYARAPG